MVHMHDPTNVSAFAARRTVAPRETSQASKDVARRAVSPKVLEPSSSIEDDELSESSASEDHNQFSVLNSDNTGSSITPKCIFEIGEDAVRVELSEDQSIAILGICNIWVKIGEIAILGARLQASPTLHRVYAPATSALPQVTAQSQNAQFVVSSTGRDLRDIQSDTKWSIWDVPGQKDWAERSFHILGYSFQYDVLLRKHLKVLDLMKWQSTMAMISKPHPEGRTVLVCGSSSTGKSTFCRACTNRLVADQNTPQRISESKSGVLLLDLDLMQPELTPPGLIYLAHVTSALFGSPDSHFAIPGSGQSRILRMHYLGGTYTGSVSNAGINAIMDLLQYCSTVRRDYPGCPVFINSSSWLFDVESLQLSSLVRMMQLSDIVYFDSSGSLKHQELLSRSMGDKCNLWGLTSKVHRSAPASTIWRSYMQSYFHLVSSQHDEPAWDPLALLSSNKVELTYSGPESMICAVVTLGERLALGNVAQALEDSIVAIVAVENAPEAQVAQSLDEPSRQFSSYLATTIPDVFDEEQTDPTYIVRTVGEGLPYLQDFDFEVSLLHPQRTECLGLGYITAIDPVREVIELVTPISQQIMSARTRHGFTLAIVMGRQDRQWAPLRE